MSIIATFLNVVFQEIIEEIVFGAFKSIVGIFTGSSSLKLTLGPYCFSVRYDDLISQIAKTGYKIAQYWKPQSTTETHYDIETRDSGILVAKSPKPLTLRQFPIELPNSYQTTAHQLRIPDPYSSIFTPSGWQNGLVPFSPKTNSVLAPTSNPGEFDISKLPPAPNLKPFDWSQLPPAPKIKPLNPLNIPPPLDIGKYWCAGCGRIVFKPTDHHFLCLGYKSR